MHWPCRLFSLLFVTALLAANPRAASSAPASPDTSARQARFAFLVGINDYSLTRLPSLEGCVQDVNDMRDVLIERFGFEPSEIQMVTDRAATREAILRGIRMALIDRAREHPGALVVFHYSGHGSRIGDTNDDESDDDFDETLVPSDGRTRSDVWDIRDDELQSLMAELGQYTSNILFILDSCHSGSATRAGQRVRFAPRDDRPSPPEPTRALFQRQSSWITLSACRPLENAGETDMAIENPGRHNGAFTFHLVRALRRANHRTTYRELLAEVSTGISEHHSQHPVFEGDLHRFLLGESLDREDPYLAVRPLRADSFEIAAGAVQGVRPGALVAVYSSTAIRLTGTAGLLAHATVERVSALTAIARSLDGSTVPSGSKAVLTTPLLSRAPLRVQLPDSWSPARRRQALRHLTPSGSSDAAFVVEPQRPPSATAVPFDLRIIPAKASASRTWRISTPDGEAIGDGYVEPLDSLTLCRMRDRIESVARQRVLRAIDNATSPLRGSIDVLIVTDSVLTSCGDRTRPGWSQDLERASNPIDWRENQEFRVVLSNRSDQSLCFTLMDLSPDGAITCLFPAEGDEGWIPARGTAVLPEALAFAPPSGPEIFKVLATTQPSDLRSWCQPATRGSRHSAGLIEHLSRPVRSTTRSGSATDSVGDEDWTTAQRLIFVRPPDR